jgi:phosphonate transport system permease protein
VTGIADSALAERELLALTELEFGAVGPDSDRKGRSRRSGRSPLGNRRLWIIAVGAAVAWSFWDAGLGRQPIVNPGGGTIATRFVSAAWRPDLSGEFLDIVVRAVAVTGAYALLATGFALVTGVIGGVLSSETFWERDRLDSRAGERRVRPGWLVTRAVAVVPRGIHEAIWALILLLILGADPMVAVLAIGIPFGAITAKVVAELIDDTAAAPYRVLRDAGASRLGALLYGTAPVIATDVVSYGFYRLECSVRSSVILGMIGAGGIGFQIAVSEDGLEYEQLWTLIYALVVMSALADWWGASLRRSPSKRRLRVSVAIAAVLTALAAWWLDVRPWTLFDADARSFAATLGSNSWPPRLPRGGWSELATASVETLQLSIMAIAIALGIAVPMAFVAARDPTGSWMARSTSGVARAVLLLLRSVPAPLWALLLLFVMFPGPIPGGVALGLYTLGILGRLGAEVIENSDRAPRDALSNSGASPASSFLYGVMPLVAPRFVSLGAYRWEVAIRETVIVGLVGAGGLGQLLRDQRAGFDYPRMFTTVITLIVLAFVVDLVSSHLRRGLR